MKLSIGIKEQKLPIIGINKKDKTFIGQPNVQL
jgi:hypothetical protein